MKTIQQRLDELATLYPHEPEFLQAVHEVVEDIKDSYNSSERFMAHNIISRLTEPDRIISFRVNWEDDAGNICVNRGWRVQFCNALGPYKGGIRFHPTVCPSVLKFLAFEQTFKNALTGLPLGGGKGGSDFNPKGKSDREIRRFCYAFMRELYTYIDAREDVPAGDINVSSTEIGYMFAMYKSLTHEFKGVLTGKSTDFGGSQVRTEATGFGVVYFLEAMLAQHSDSHSDSHSNNMAQKTVLVSGAGNVALHAALKAMQLGATVVSLSNSSGAAFIEHGLTQAHLDWLLDPANKGKRLDVFCTEFAGAATWHEGKKPWSFAQKSKADVALPCATQNEVSLDDAKQLVDGGVKYIVEGANMPLTADAIHHVQAYGVVYAPGKAANAGGVAVSGLEMSQNAKGKYESFATLDAELKTIMQHIHTQCVNFGKTKDGDSSTINYKKGANVAGFSLVAEALCDYGVL